MDNTSTENNVNKYNEYEPKTEEKTEEKSNDDFIVPSVVTDSEDSPFTAEELKILEELSKVKSHPTADEFIGWIFMYFRKSCNGAF